MIRKLPRIKTKQELVKAIQSIKLEQIEIIEPYDPKQSNQLTKAATQMSTKPGSVSIILLRSQ